MPTLQSLTRAEDIRATRVGHRLLEDAREHSIGDGGIGDMPIQGDKPGP